MYSMMLRLHCCNCRPMCKAQSRALASKASVWKTPSYATQGVRAKSIAIDTGKRTDLSTGAEILVSAKRTGLRLTVIGEAGLMKWTTEAGPAREAT